LQTHFFFSKATHPCGFVQRQRKDFDFLINNAGIDVYSPFDQTTEDAFDRLLNAHFRGVYFLTQRMLPLIANGGRIVCTSTGLTRFAMPGYAAYASMKGAIEVLIKYLAKELGPRETLCFRSLGRAGNMDRDSLFYDGVSGCCGAS
jgi:NAD(P)-dependent dehydrogenase (short-subunit alcohol dehydrogenase family)